MTTAERPEEGQKGNDALFRSLAESAPDALVIVDREGRIVLVNSQTEKMFGYSRDELLGELVEILVPEQLRKAHIDHRAEYDSDPCTRLLGSGLELVARRKDGSEFAAEIGLNPVETKDGMLVASLVRDVTARKKAAEALRESEEMYRSLVELSPDAVAVHRDGEIVFINTSGAQLLGAGTAEEIMGKSIWDLVHPDYHEIVGTRVRQSLAEGRKLEPIEEKLVRLDGEVIDVEIAGMAITYQGRPASQVVVRDITARKRAEEVLQKAREDLERKVERQMRQGNRYGLSFRELTVIHLVAAGSQDKEAATVLGISSRTVQKHVENVLSKMGAATRTEASVRAVREGLIE